MYSIFLSRHTFFGGWGGETFKYRTELVIIFLLPPATFCFDLIKSVQDFKWMPIRLHILRSYDCPYEDLILRRTCIPHTLKSTGPEQNRCEGPPCLTPERVKKIPTAVTTLYCPIIPPHWTVSNMPGGDQRLKLSVHNAVLFLGYSNFTSVVR